MKNCFFKMLKKCDNMYMVNVMKKVLLILISFIMLFMLGGCGEVEKDATIYGVKSKDNIKEIIYAYDNELNITKNC
ncbi:MAG: hypothetical protein L6V81_05705 [Clostridium sp.]|nr:MAG: hypothetical protein L6V81_05705 [Clostridium sp.]